MTRHELAQWCVQVTEPKEENTMPKIQTTTTHVIVQCAEGHMLASCRLAEWAGSETEAKASQSWPCPCCQK